MEIQRINEWLFCLVLLWAGWQDLKTRSVHFGGLLLSGTLGIMMSVFGRRAFMELVFSCGLGLALLVLSRLTDGKIGEGDGWFFMVSGLFLRWEENILLFFGGLGTCFLAAVVMIFRRVLGGPETRAMALEKQKGLPLLTFLVPTGIWMIFLKPI